MAMEKEYVLFITLLLCLAGGCTTSPGGESDIPCFNPAAWTEEVLFFEVKNTNDESGNILLRSVSLDRVAGPVYLFDVNTGGSRLVDDNEWEQSEGLVVDCRSIQVRDSPFESLLFPPRTLSFEGEVVPTIGRNGVTLVYPPSSPSIVYVSTDGDVDINGVGASGQLYYQVFSELDGSALTEPLRIAITGRGNEEISGCFSPDEKLAIFHQNVVSSELEAKICIGEMP